MLSPHARSPLRSCTSFQERTHAGRTHSPRPEGGTLLRSGSRLNHSGGFLYQRAA